MRCPSLLCGLEAVSELIPTDIDESELSLNLMIFTDQGQVENISSCPKMPKNSDFRRFTWLQNANFLTRHQINEPKAYLCCSLDVESNNVVLVARGQAVPEIGGGQVETFAIQDWSSLTDTKPELNRLMVLTLVHSSPLLELIGTQIWPLILAELTVEPDSSPAAPRFVITVLPATGRCAVGQHQISDREIHFSDRG